MVVGLDLSSRLRELPMKIRTYGQTGKFIEVTGYHCASLVNRLSKKKLSFFYKTLRDLMLAGF